MTEHEGSGFSITNSNITGSAVGSANARVTYLGGASTPSPELSQLLASIAELSQRLARAEIAGRDDLTEAADQLAAEVAVDKPDKFRVLGLLSHLGTGVKGVATLATAVTSVATAVSAVLGIG